MYLLNKHKVDITKNGFTVLDNVFDSTEIDRIFDIIENTETTNPTFRRSADLFAIRQFLKEVPAAIKPIFNDKLKDLINELFGEGYFVVKSIYFDKPETSNWFVAWHQDLTISVDKKADVQDFFNWTVKHNQFAVQPPLEVLEDDFTIRIHLDDTDKDNGALKVIPGSHLKGVQRFEDYGVDDKEVEICEVKRGGVMVMRPLLMHASDRTINNERRRVIHIEFSRTELPSGINWSELIN